MGLKRDLKLLDVFAISTGAMISSGLFVLPGLAYAISGPAMILVYMLASLLIISSMLAKAELSTAMPKAGTYFYNVSRGFDDREVKPERIRKSFGAERTFEEDIIQYKMLHDKLKSIAEELGRRLEKYGISGKTVTLKVKYHDFELKTRCAGFSSHKSSPEEIYTITKNLLHSSDLPRKPIRLLGISLSNLNTAENADRNTQLTLEF